MIEEEEKNARIPPSIPSLLGAVHRRSWPCSSSSSLPMESLQSSLPSPAPSLTNSAPATCPPSPPSTFALPPSPASSPSSLSTATASSGFSLAILNLSSPTSTSLATPSTDLSSSGHRYLDVIPRQPPLSSYCVAIVGHPGHAAVGAGKTPSAALDITATGNRSWTPGSTFFLAPSATPFGSD